MINNVEKYSPLMIMRKPPRCVVVTFFLMNNKIPANNTVNADKANMNPII